MASIIKVDTIQDQDGNNIINESSDTITIGAAGDTVNVVGTLQNNGTAVEVDSVTFKEGGTNFINHCKKNIKWAGCKEIVDGIKKFEDVGMKSASNMFGNADCLVPGICDGNVVLPSSGRPNACANKLAICNQKLDASNIEAQKLMIEQGC